MQSVNTTLGQLSKYTPPPMLPQLLFATFMEKTQLVIVSEQFTA
jgi:hypothetical protein